MRFLTAHLHDHAGAETPRSLSRLLAALSRELPGISLSQRLLGFDRVSHQHIIDLLGMDGENIFLAPLARHACSFVQLEAI